MFAVNPVITFEKGDVIGVTAALVPEDCICAAVNEFETVVAVDTCETVIGNLALICASVPKLLLKAIVETFPELFIYI